MIVISTDSDGYRESGEIFVYLSYAQNFYAGRSKPQTVYIKRPTNKIFQNKTWFKFEAWTRLGYCYFFVE